MDIESYSDLERDINRLTNNKETYQELLRQIDSNNQLSDSEKEERKKTTFGYIDDLSRSINELKEMKNAYDTYINNIKEIQGLYASGQSKEMMEANLQLLRAGIIEARKKMPSKLQTEAMHKAEEYVSSLSAEAAGFDNEKGKVDFKSEYEKLSKEMDNVLKGVPVDEVGLNDFDGLFNGYNELSEKMEKILERIKSSKSSINPSEFDELLKQDKELSNKLGSLVEELETVKQMKEAIRDKLQFELDQKNSLLASMDEQINDCNEKISNPEKYGLSPENLEHLKNTLKHLNEQRELVVNRIDELNNNMKKVKEGGKLDQELLDSLAYDEAEELTPPRSEPKKEEKKEPEVAPTPPKKKTPRKKGAAKPKKAVKPESLDGLIKSGLLPKYMPREELLRICDELGITITDRDMPLNPEQIDRLKEDHEIQMALLNQSLFERNQKKIQEYDQLIAKYETILYDKMNAKSFTPSYIKKVQKLLDKLISERDKFVQANGEYGKKYYSEELRGLSVGREDGLDTWAVFRNDQLRKQYRKLDEIRSKKHKSKFRQKRQEKRIKKVLKRIDALKAKKSKIASKQTQIINKNSKKYIERVTAKINKYLNRQTRLETRVDRINEISDRIEQVHEERERVRDDLEDERKFFDKVALAIQSGKLGRQESKLEHQIDRENFFGRFR